ncbi:hypothetical protein BDR03DRAFT_201049 [Suillus americanus]|nr:hypothetical protein BDR03DRAFT_201049 [Suillus americanus]
MLFPFALSASTSGKSSFSNRMKWNTTCANCSTLPPIYSNISMTRRILRVVLPVVDSHPMFFIAWFLHCFIFAGFSSQNTIFRAVTALWLVTYVINIGTILMETMWKHATSLNHA